MGSLCVGPDRLRRKSLSLGALRALLTLFVVMSSPQLQTDRFGLRCWFERPRYSPPSDQAHPNGRAGSVRHGTRRALGCMFCFYDAGDLGRCAHGFILFLWKLAVYFMFVILLP
jgi:hypothetical protein